MVEKECFLCVGYYFWETCGKHSHLLVIDFYFRNHLLSDELRQFFFPPTVWKMKPFFSVTTIHFFCLFSSTCCCIINEKSRVLYWIVWCCLFRRKDQALYFSRKFNVMYAPIPKFTRYILNFVFIKIQFRIYIYIGAGKKTYCTYLTNQVSRCQMSIHCADELSLDVGLAGG